jgi:primosomal protein N' (replication factor Y)
VARRWVELVQEKEVAPEPEVKTEIREPDFELTGEQQAALQKAEQRLAEGRFHVTLLFGVSGSGKTEIYLRAIRRAVAAGRQAILLVPEILLTTQLVERLTSRLPGLAVMHSGLTEAHRSLIWRRVAAGKKTVVVGPRSAVFAPCPNLGLICVDEEQEAGYKNLRSPRFHVRDVAILRAKKLNIPVLLGSATPSLEMWHLSETHSDYERVYLRHRVKDRPLPKVHLIDMRQEYQEAKGSVALSRRMLEMIEETLAAREQAMILINRRGSSRRVFCPACRMRIACPNCGVSLVVHADTGQSICHYCRHRIPTPVHCPNVTCAQPLIQTGAGSQRVEALLRARFPAARIQRVDTDSLKRREQYHSVVNQLSSGELDIAVGTQMIAKGLDFPGVSFVGVVDADAVGGLAVDFRAHERLFQLMTQVAGRAGRGDRPGRVVVQTTSPELPALHYAVRHDYEGFAASELPHRKALKLPPYRRLVRLIVSHTRDETARREANEVAQRIRERIQAFEYRDCAVSGPHTPVFARLRGRYRHDVLLAVPTTALMRRLLRECTNGGDCRVKSAALTVDVDPVQLA